MRKMLVCATGVLLLPCAYAVEYPEVKEGLWSVHTQSIHNPGNKKSEGKYTICRDHAFDKSVQAKMKEMKGCSPISENLQRGRYTAELRCVVNGTTIVSKGTTMFQGDSAFHSESHATYTPPMYGMTETTMIMDEKYVGSCPPGTKPGDRTNADGKVMHLGNH